MSRYPFDLIQPERPGPLADKTLLSERPFARVGGSLETDAEKFIPGEPLATAINTAIAVGEPLLITGEPGTGKTQTAYYAAYKLDLKPVIHFQVKSDSTARDLLYHFDTVRYFHDAHLLHLKGQDAASTLDKQKYVEPRALWEAFASASTRGTPRVLLIDEIDKAPRDFPNDLLHELDQMEFKVIETDQKVAVERRLAPIVFITSNSERRLPEPFLRRCVYHHIRFDDEIIRRAVQARRERGEFEPLAEGFIDTAIQRFLALRDRGLRKRPATGELLVWLRVLAVAVGTSPEKLDQDLSKLPYLGALLKDHQDLEEIGAGRV